MNTVINFFQKIWTASIRRQLMLGIILVHAVLMSIFVYDLVERQRAFLHTQSVEQAKGLATTLAVNSTTWVLANDVVGLEEILSAQIKYPSLRYAMVLSPKGQVLGHTEIEKVGLFLSDAISKKLLTAKQDQLILVNNDTSVDMASRIISNGVFIGWARVSLSQKENEKNLQIITRDGLGYTVLAIVIGGLFAFFMAKGITLGLQHIVDVAEGIKEGNQTLRADISRHDEIGKLGQDFNIMLDTIENSKRDLKAIMDNSPAIIHVKDTEGRFTFINRKFLTLYNMSSEDVLGKTLYELFTKDIADKIRRNDLDVISAGLAIESEEVAPHPDGVMHTYASVKFPLRDENDDIYALCGISTDITDRINMVKEQADLENQLLHTQKVQAIGQLTGGVAHDFNNLLSVILGYAELGQAMFGKENEKLNDYLDEIYKAGSRGRELIQQMMIYSRKDQSKNDLMPLKIEAVIEETIGMLKATFPTSIHIETQVEKNIPNIKANASLISQVLMNLCINAKDGMSNEGNLLISANVEHFESNVCRSCAEVYSGDFVAIKIKDNGKGIPEDILNRIFEPFFTLKKVGEGTGMGLSVVHGVVHKLGGHIAVNSTIGEGTEFKILLPSSSEKIERSDSGIKDVKAKFDFSGLRIMVVDDEPAVAGLLEAALQQCNARVDMFLDSQKALEYFKNNKEKIDMVITDQTMPNLTGIELSEKLLAIRKDIPIILCTGYSIDVNEESAHKLGIKAYMDKPVKNDNLYQIINSLR